MFERNLGYIDKETQEKLGKIKILFAGCGVGSAPVEALTRLGVKNFILADGDTIEEHNLNRQFFNFEDIGTLKVDALKKRIEKINPHTKIIEIAEYLDKSNTLKAVQSADFIFDTIDFLDLEAIVRLHDICNTESKPIFSLFTAGFGCVGIFIPPRPQKMSWIREIFELGTSDVTGTYKDHFFKFFEKISIQLNPSVQKTMGEVFMKMKDGIPCPAPHVISGSMSAGALAAHILTKYIAGEKMTSAPKFIYLDLEAVESKLVISLNLDEKKNKNRFTMLCY